VPPPLVTSAAIVKYEPPCTAVAASVSTWASGSTAIAVKAGVIEPVRTTTAETASGGEPNALTRQTTSAWPSSSIARVDTVP